MTGGEPPPSVGGQSAKTLLGVYKPCDTKPLLMSMYLCVSLFVCGTGSQVPVHAGVHYY